MISIIVAVAENGVIGRGNRLPWHLPGDLQWFRRNTVGKAVVMGRLTFESIGRPLPERLNIVITRDTRFTAPGCAVAHSLEEALRIAGEGEAMVMGGEQLYRQTLPLARRLYLTQVHAEVEGDAWFPAIDWSEWHEVSREDRPADERNPYAFSFRVLERRG